MKLLHRRRPARTGNRADDDLLSRIQPEDRSRPRPWTHALYVADEASAREAAAAVLSDGWDLERVEPAPNGNRWVVVAGQRDAVLSPDRVAAARRFFESLAQRTAGGDYRGWQSED